MEIKELCPESISYPPLLAKSKYAVPKLWLIGNDKFEDEFCIAMVGTRSPSGIAANTIKQAIKSLRGLKVRIVSGLAQGIDSFCHKEAMANKLPTTAVIAQGLDIPLQSSQQAIADKILEEGGNIISPFAPGTRAYLSSFIIRNTIITGMSNATIIAESRLKGGAMHTANFCVKENKPLFAFPGSPLSPTSEGCNKLIEQQKAKIVWSVNDLPNILGLNSLFSCYNAPSSSQNITTLNGNNFELPSWAVKGTVMQISDICEQNKKPINEILVMLTELELQGICRVNGQEVIF